MVWRLCFPISLPCLLLQIPYSSIKSQQHKLGHQTAPGALFCCHRIANRISCKLMCFWSHAPCSDDHPTKLSTHHGQVGIKPNQDVARVDVPIHCRAIEPDDLYRSLPTLFLRSLGPVLWIVTQLSLKTELFISLMSSALKSPSKIELIRSQFYAASYLLWRYGSISSRFL